MNISDITTVIGSLGFPIFACCMLGWYIYKTEDKQTECLTSLTQAINELLIRLKEDKKDGESK